MLTGRTPFNGDTEFIIMKSHLEDKPESPIRYNSKIPKWLSAVIIKSISKGKDKRYSSAEELMIALKTRAKSNNFNAVPDLLKNQTFIYLNLLRMRKYYKISVSVTLIILLVIFVLGRLNKYENLVNDNKQLSTDIIIKPDNRKLSQEYSMDLINGKPDNIDNTGFVVFEPEHVNQPASTSSDENTINVDDTQNKGVLYNTVSGYNNRRYDKPEYNIKKLKKKKYTGTSKSGVVNKPGSKWKIRK